jgi:SAM-dependent methyltransferase
MSVAYYDQNAEQFFNDTVAADVSELRDRFVQEQPPGGRVLDAGCGSGRDSKAFVELGFDVTAFDASAEMVARASQHAGCPVIQMTFEEMTWTGEFDGIWASASLLHVPRSSLAPVLSQFRRALRPAGVLYASFKYGQAEREKEGRRFTDLNEGSFQQLLADAGGLQVIDLWRTSDVRPGRQDEMWLNTLARKV